MIKFTGEQAVKNEPAKSKPEHTANNAKWTGGQRGSDSDNESLQALETSETPVTQPKNQCKQLGETTKCDSGDFIVDDKKENGTDEPFPETSSAKQEYTYTASYQPLEKSFADATGEFVIPAQNGNKLVYILYHHDSNFIFAVPIKSTSDVAQTEAFDQVYDTLEKTGLAPKLHIVDNQCGPKLKTTMDKKGIKFQLVPPGNHRCNVAERAIQTFKAHFISILCGTDPNCPIVIWDKFVKQAEITLNLMRASRIDPTKSAYEQIHGAFDFNSTPMAPIGQAVMVHDKPESRQSWDPRAQKGYYIAPALRHYRCFEIYMEESKKTRISDTVVWLTGVMRAPKKQTVVKKSEMEMDELHDIERRLTEIFDPSTVETHAGEMRVGTGTTPSEVENGPEMRVDGKSTPPIILPPVSMGPPPQPPEGPQPTFAEVTGNAGKKYRKKLREQRQRRLPEKLREHHADNAEITENAITVEIFRVESDAEYLAFYGHAVDPDTKKLAEFRELIKSSDAPLWWEGMEDEFGRLMDGTDRDPNGGTKTMEFVKRSEIPRDKPPTYARIVVAYRPEKEKKHRVRITVGGDRVIYEGEVSTKAADLTTVKTHMNSVVSTKDA